MKLWQQKEKKRVEKRALAEFKIKIFVWLMNKMQLENYLREVGRQKSLDLVFVIIPDYIGGASPYRMLKF